MNPALLLSLLTCANKRHVYPWAPSQTAARRHPADARAAYRGRHFPRSNGPRLRNERVPLGAP